MTGSARVTPVHEPIEQWNDDFYPSATESFPSASYRTADWSYGLPRHEER